MHHTRRDISCASLKDLYLQKKYSLVTIGKLLGFSSRTVEIRAKECRIKLRNPGLPGPKIGAKRLIYLYLKRGLSSRKIAKQYECAYSTVDNKIKRLNLPRRTLSAAHLVTKRLDFSGNLEEKAYLIGFRIGDLRVRKMYKNSETILADCGSTKAEQIKLIRGLFGKYGRIWVSKPGTSGKMQIECGLNQTFSFLLKKYSVFPHWIVEKNGLSLWALAGFIDAEGSFFVNGTRKSSGFCIGNYNLAILKQIRSWLIALGFCPRLFKSVKKGYTGKDGYSHREDYWIVSVYRKKEVLGFAEKILPYLKHKDRIFSARRVIKNINNRNSKYGFIGM